MPKNTDAGLKTTRPVREVHTIEDIEAIERHPYDEVVTARNIYDLFRATAAHHGERPALTVMRSEDPADIGCTFTHAEILGEITRAANMFRGLGLVPGTGVAAFLVPTLPELPALLLGAQVAGVASSINYLLTRAAIVDLLNAQGATILVIPARAKDEDCWSKTRGIAGDVPTLKHVIVIGDDVSGEAGLAAALRPHSSEALTFVPTQDRDGVCALFHTGGTTGLPKLVQLTHGNQIHAAFAFAQVFGYDERDVVINGFPFFHVGGTMTVGLAVLAAGGHMVVPSPYALRPKPVVAAYWDIVRAFGVTVINGVPTSIGALTRTFRNDGAADTVRIALTGGATCPEAVGARFMETTSVRLFETYGMTETAAAIAFNPGRGEPLEGSAGFRAPYSETRIVRVDAGAPTPCAVGENGLVQVRGPQVFPGYVDPVHNAGTLMPDGWLTTGDVGYLTADQRLVLTGREKDLIVRSGHNIDPAAIEDVANRFAGVEVSAAVGMPDQYAGEAPILFVVPAADAEIDMNALAFHLERGVHEPPARPKAILCIDALPVTAVGKVFKPALREMAIAEKVRLEVLANCSETASASTTFETGARNEIIVTITVEGATDGQLAALAVSLKPLPQTYIVRQSD